MSLTGTGPLYKNQTQKNKKRKKKKQSIHEKKRLLFQTCKPPLVFPFVWILLPNRCGDDDPLVLVNPFGFVFVFVAPTLTFFFNSASNCPLAAAISPANQINKPKLT